MKVLILTVGGSPEPLKKAINYLKPDFIYFITSDDTSTQKGSYTQIEGSDSSTIPNELKLPSDSWESIRVKNADDLDSIFEKIRETIKKAKKRFPSAQFLIDYSGGTKSMSIGLALAGIEESCELHFVGGLRKDLNKVASGSETVLKIKIQSLRYDNLIKQVDMLWSNYYYFSAATLVEDTIPVLSREKEENAKLILFASKGLGEWERFQYKKAVELLGPISDSSDKLKEFAEITGILKGSIEKGGDYIVVLDILKNAERRAKQERFDDAVGRVYRAVELMAQIRLRKEYKIDSSAVPVNRVPPELRGEFLTKYSKDKEGNLKIPLMASYKLLVSLKDPIYKEWFADNKRLIEDFLTSRNNSFYAHGLNPIDITKFKKAQEVVKKIIELIEQLGPKECKILPEQFPDFPRSVHDIFTSL